MDNYVVIEILRGIENCVSSVNRTSN